MLRLVIRAQRQFLLVLIVINQILLHANDQSVAKLMEILVALTDEPWEAHERYSVISKNVSDGAANKSP